MGSKKRKEREAKSAKRTSAACTKENKQALKLVGPKTDGQIEYVKAMEEHPVTLAIGPAGTGKTFLAVNMAVKGLVLGKYSKIVLTRPAVEAAGERLGSLPGDMVEKINPYMAPLYDSLGKILGKVETNRLLESEIIEIVPLAYMRGRTLDNAFIIMDEAQNTTPEQVKMLMTRLGAESKMVITGDLHQSDISNPLEERKGRKRSGLEDAVLRFSDDDQIAVARLRLCDVQRHPLIRHIIRAYDLQLPEKITIQDVYNK